MKINTFKYLPKSGQAEDQHFFQTAFPDNQRANFSLNLFIRFFWNCTWLQALMNEQKWLFWIFKGNFDCDQNELKRMNYGRKISTRNLFLNLFFRFFWNCTFCTGINEWVKMTVLCFLRAIHIIVRNG